MQGSRGNRHPFFDFPDPFSGMGGFGGFGGHGSLFPSVFGGRDPFDDPFFRNPFGRMIGPSMGNAQPFMGMPASGFIEDHPPQPRRSRGPIIEEINSDNEEEDTDEHVEAERRSPPNNKKHRRSSRDPSVQGPDDEPDGRKNKLVQHGNMNWPNKNHWGPQTQSFCFQSSSVSYGGRDGVYYTSASRRTGSDGVTIEERKEADTSTGRASHRVSRGIHNKGHSVTRKLNPDGRVDTMQTLHNLNEDELSGFENAWNGKVGKQLPGWDGAVRNIGSGSGRNHGDGHGRQLPSLDYHPRQYGGKHRSGSGGGG